MLASFSAELFKIRKRTAYWLIAAVWMTMTLLFGYVFRYLDYRGDPTGPDAGEVLAEALPASLVTSAIQGFPMFAGALAMLVGVLCAGSEHDWDTMKMLFTQGPARLSVLAGTVAALLTTMLAIVLATFAVAGGASWLVAMVTSRPVDWPPAGSIATGVLAGWLIVSVWAMGGLFLATAVRRTALAAGLGLAWALAVENLMRLFAAAAGPIEVLQRFSPGTNAGSLAAALGVTQQGRLTGTPGVVAAVGGTQATIVLVAYVVVFAVISAVTTRRRDVV